MEQKKRKERERIGNAFLKLIQITHSFMVD